MQESPVRAEARHHHPPTPSPPSRGNGVRGCVGVRAGVCGCVDVWGRAEGWKKARQM